MAQLFQRLIDFGDVWLPLPMGELRGAIRDFSFLASKYLENINEDQLASIIKWFMIESFICYLDKIFVLVKMNDNLCLQIDAVIRSEEIIGNRIFEKKI